MSAYIRLIYDRIEFLEFKQSILFLKQPQHKAAIFEELSLECFLQIRDMTISVSEKIIAGEKYTIGEYEQKLFELWPPIKSYPSSSSLVAKALMSSDVFSSLFSYNN